MYLRGSADQCKQMAEDVCGAAGRGARPHLPHTRLYSDGETHMLPYQLKVSTPMKYWELVRLRGGVMCMR